MQVLRASFASGLNSGDRTERVPERNRVSIHLQVATYPLVWASEVKDPDIWVGGVLGGGGGVVTVPPSLPFLYLFAQAGKHPTHVDCSEHPFIKRLFSTGT